MKPLKIAPISLAKLKRRVQWKVQQVPSPPRYGGRRGTCEE